MKLFLAGTFIAEELTKKYKPLYVLESFYYIKPWQIQEMSNWKMFLLDSGAFTFLHAAERKRVDWDAYLSKYIAFIKANGIEYFFELDIDAIVGYESVKAMRRRLESETERRCIPVWHRSRGLEEFKRHWNRRLRHQNNLAKRVPFCAKAHTDRRRLWYQGARAGVYPQGRSGIWLFQRGQHNMEHSRFFWQYIVFRWAEDCYGSATARKDGGRPPPPKGICVAGMD